MCCQRQLEKKMLNENDKINFLKSVLEAHWVPLSFKTGLICDIIYKESILKPLDLFFRTYKKYKQKENATLCPVHFMQ